MSEIKDKEDKGDVNQSKKWKYFTIAGITLLVLVLSTYFYTKSNQNNTQISQVENQSIKPILPKTQLESKDIVGISQPNITSNPILNLEPRSVAFEGKIGDLTLLMSLNFKDGEIRGQYRYSSQDEYLQLSGRQENGNLKLEETVYIEKEGMKKTGTFDGVYDGKNYVGKWKNYSKEFEFNLKQIFNYTEKELKVGFDEVCAKQFDGGNDQLEISVEDLVYSSKLKQYYFVVGVGGGGCNGSANYPWVLYSTKDGSNLNILKDLSAPSGMSTGGVIRISPNSDYLYIYEGIHGGICANYNYFLIYDLLKSKIVFDSASRLDYNKINGSLSQYFKKWINNNEIEYYEFTNDCTNAANPIDKTIVKRAKF